MKTHDERERQIAAAGLGYDIHEINRLAVALGENAHMAGFIDAEVTTAPAVYIVEFAGFGDVEGCVGFHGLKIDNGMCRTLANGSGLFRRDPAFSECGAP